jgi:hypothetical protein
MEKERVMKRTTWALALLLLSAGALAQGTSTPGAPGTDYSRSRLQQLFVETDIENGGVRYSPGAVTFGALGTTWRYNYVPIMLPLSGSGVGLGAVTQEWPDPFALTGTAIATPFRAWRTVRQKNRELMRIERLERGRFRVEVNAGNR